MRTYAFCVLATYDEQRGDRNPVRKGLIWLAESVDLARMAVWKIEEE